MTWIGVMHELGEGVAQVIGALFSAVFFCVPLIRALFGFGFLLRVDASVSLLRGRRSHPHSHSPSS
jgi:hypothetical protein